MEYKLHGIYDGNLHVAELMNFPSQDEYANLFAAAPDLLAAAEKFVAARTTNELAAALEATAAALAKAKTT